MRRARDIEALRDRVSELEQLNRELEARNRWQAGWIERWAPLVAEHQGGTFTIDLVEPPGDRRAGGA